MTYIKALGLLAATTAALMSLTATASATTLTGPTGDPTPSVHAVNENGHVKISNPIATIECASTFEFIPQSHGTGVTASGSLSSLTFGSPVGTCTNSWHVTIVAPGSIEFHYLEPSVATVTSTGTTITATRLGVTCTYLTNATDIGKLTDSNKTSGNATIHLEASLALHSGSSPLCGSGSHKWAGSYVTTAGLFLDA